jgi:hypothetical protein
MGKMVGQVVVVLVTLLVEPETPLALLRRKVVTVVMGVAPAQVVVAVVVLVLLVLLAAIQMVATVEMVLPQQLAGVL